MTDILPADVIDWKKTFDRKRLLPDYFLFDIG